MESKLLVSNIMFFMISFSHEVRDNLEQGQRTDIIVMDFNKAFKEVDHHELLFNFFFKSFNSEVISWVGSFLYQITWSYSADCCWWWKLRQSIRLVWCPSRLGIPGTCLYFSYINDLPDSANGKVRPFADNTILLSCNQIHPRVDHHQKPGQTDAIFEDTASLFFHFPPRSIRLWNTCVLTS